MENTEEHDHEATTQPIARYKLYGKILGAIAIIFNTIGIVFFLAYSKTLDILFNIIFWMFGRFYILVHLFVYVLILEQVEFVLLNYFSHHFNYVRSMANWSC